MIYLKSVLAGIAAIAAFNVLIMGVCVMLLGGYWGFDFSLAGLATPAGALPMLLIFGSGFYWEFRRLSKRRSSSR